MELRPCKDPVLFTNVMMDVYNTIPVTPNFFPKGTTPQVREFLIEQTRQQMASDDGSIWMEAVDTSTGEVFGVTKWAFNYKPVIPDPSTLEIGTMDQAAQQTSGQNHGDEKAEGVADLIDSDLFALAANRKAQFCKEYFADRPFMNLNSLAILERHQRKGIGSLCVRKCIELAEENGLEIFLESTKGGERLYEKFGFETMAIAEYPDVRGKPYTQKIMVRKLR